MEDLGSGTFHIVLRHEVSQVHFIRLCYRCGVHLSRSTWSNVKPLVPSNAWRVACLIEISDVRGLAGRVKLIKYIRGKKLTADCARSIHLESKNLQSQIYGIQLI